MPLDAARANDKTSAINDAFADIGRSNGTIMPRSKGNLEPLAWEVFVSKHLKRIADAREKKAVTAAVKAGVMFDPEKQPLSEGTNALVYAGDVVEIAVSVTTAAEKLDTESLWPALEKAGIARVKLDKLVKQHTHPNRGPHKFVCTLVTTR